MTDQTKNTKETWEKDLLSELASGVSSSNAPSINAPTTQEGTSDLAITQDQEINKPIEIQVQTQSQPQAKPKVSLDSDLDELIAASAEPTSHVASSNTDKSKWALGMSADFAKKEEAKQKILKEKKIPQRLANYSISIVVLIFLFLVGLLFFFFLRYKETATVPSYLEKYMPKVEKTYYSVRNLFWLWVPDAYSDNILIPKWTWSNAIVDIIDDTHLDYVSKKEIITKWVKYLYKETSGKYDQFEELKKKVSQQWFFPTELQEMSEGTTFNNSIQKAIVSIESVRFATALNFFSSLDSFMTQLSSRASINKIDLTKMVDVFMQRWEKDINNYIVSCYLNGYELTETCGVIGDFNMYYNIYQTTGFNADTQRAFLVAMDLIQNKLENTDFPSLDVSMRSIDPLQNTINLNIEINTFREDEVQLIQSKGILNPHIYLVTSIINNLRESRYVITETINISTLKVNKKKIKVWWENFTVNSSTFNFQLPLQSTVQREIYDFADLWHKTVSELININPLNDVANPLDNVFDLVPTDWELSWQVQPLPQDGLEEPQQQPAGVPEESAIE